MPSNLSEAYLQLNGHPSGKFAVSTYYKTTVVEDAF